jgi:uncharacterized protein YndB with AHSA1/START domain
MTADEHTLLEAAIVIEAPVATVWRVFTDPHLSRQLGGEYISTWVVGADFGWQGLDGQRYTSGTIVQIEPERVLQHTVDQPTVSTAGSLITYAFKEEQDRTVLVAREAFASAITETEYADALEGWHAALQQVKQIAEAA